MDARAAVLHESTESGELSAEKPASIETIEVADPTGEEVLVDIHAASLCHTDVSIARGEMDRPFPLVMGHEGAGVVRAVGDDVETVSPGDHVVLGRMACGKCNYCVQGRSYLCVKRSESHRRGTLRTGHVRFSGDGGERHHCHGVSSFSEHTLVTEEVAIPITDELPLEKATLLGCGVFTGAGAVMNTADIEPGASVVVFGAGGVGLSAVQAAAIRGAGTIVAVDVVPEKLDIASTLGASHTIDASRDDPVDAVTEVTGGGADYAFEVVGNAAVAEQAIDVLAPAGTAVLVGTPPVGKHDLDVDLHEMVTSEKQMIGSFNGSYNLPLAIPDLAEMAAAGTLSLDALITDTKSLDEVNEAMADLETGSDIRQVIRL